MQTAFVTILEGSTYEEDQILLGIKDAPGFLSCEEFSKKEDGITSKIVFCRLEDGELENFKNFLTEKFAEKILIQKGIKL